MIVLWQASHDCVTRHVGRRHGRRGNAAALHVTTRHRFGRALEDAANVAGLASDRLVRTGQREARGKVLRRRSWRRGRRLRARRAMRRPTSTRATGGEQSARDAKRREPPIQSRRRAMDRMSIHGRAPAGREPPAGRRSRATTAREPPDVAERSRSCGSARTRQPYSPRWTSSLRWQLAQSIGNVAIFTAGRHVAAQRRQPDGARRPARSGCDRDRSPTCANRARCGTRRSRGRA